MGYFYRSIVKTEIKVPFCAQYIHVCIKVSLFSILSVVIFFALCAWNYGPGSSVAIPTELRAGRSGIESRWLLGPNFRLWPRQRHLATLWILANLVYYLVHNCRTISLEEYIDYLRRARWKKYRETKRRKTVGKYLEIL